MALTWMARWWKKMKNKQLRIQGNQVSVCETQIQFHPDQINFVVHRSHLAIYETTELKCVNQGWLFQRMGFIGSVVEALLGQVLMWGIRPSEMVIMSSSRTSTLEVEAYPALEELISQLSTLNLERVRQIKSRLVALSSRVQKVYARSSSTNPSVTLAHVIKSQKQYRWNNGWSADRGTRFVCYVISLLAGLARRNLADTETAFELGKRNHTHQILHQTTNTAL
ncbi:hypothetical protein JHK87_048075 [Glycine soja]|nr:hypothetical protein JHK87_048075 [Glycine soja]